MSNAKYVTIIKVASDLKSTVREKSIWSPADFVHLHTDKEIIHL